MKKAGGYLSTSASEAYAPGIRLVVGSRDCPHRFIQGASMTIEEKLERIEALLVVLVERQTVKDWYSTDEFAQLVGKAEFTVREWCRNARIHAEKRMSGRGAFPAWVVSHQELLRYQREGLLPLRRPG
jgi:hypothetical protein